MRFKSYPFVLCALGAGSLAYAVPGKTKLKIDRCPEYAEVDSLFMNVGHPGAMSGQVVTDDELMPLFEAARWAPSSYNEQPWRFLYARNGTPEWQYLL